MMPCLALPSLAAPYQLGPGGFEDWSLTSEGSEYRQIIDGEYVPVEYPFDPQTNPYIAMGTPGGLGGWFIGGKFSHGSWNGSKFTAPDGQVYEWSYFDNLVRSASTETYILAGTVLSGTGQFGTWDRPQYPDALTITIGSEEVFRLAIKDVIGPDGTPGGNGLETLWSDVKSWSWTAPASGVYKVTLKMVEDFEQESYGSLGDMTITMPSAVPDEGTPLALLLIGCSACAAGAIRAQPRRRWLSRLGFAGTRTGATIAGIALATTLSISSEAQFVFDAATDFSATQNSAAAWAYGWRDPQSGVFQAYGARGSSGALQEWGNSATDPGADFKPPYVLLNSSDQPVEYSLTVLALPKRLILHPGPNGEASILRWTAPFDGPVQIESAAEGRDQTPGVSTLFEVYHGAEKIFTSAVLGKNAESRVTFHTNLVVRSGETLDFAIGTTNDFTFDSTQLDAGIVYGPNPTNSNVSSGGMLEFRNRQKLPGGVSSRSGGQCLASLA